MTPTTTQWQYVALGAIIIFIAVLGLSISRNREILLWSGTPGQVGSVAYTSHMGPPGLYRITSVRGSHTYGTQILSLDAALNPTYGMALASMMNTAMQVPAYQGRTPEPLERLTLGLNINSDIPVILDTPNAPRHERNRP